MSVLRQWFAATGAFWLSLELCFGKLEVLFLDHAHCLFHQRSIFRCNFFELTWKTEYFYLKIFDYIFDFDITGFKYAVCAEAKVVISLWKNAYNFISKQAKIFRG